MTKISYAIPVCNEYEELKRLLEFLKVHKRQEDEVVVLCDEGNTTEEVKDVLATFFDDIAHIAENPLNKDFAQQKNYLTKVCTGDWVFLIDADEYINEYLCTVLPDLIDGNPDVEAYWVSRINTVEGLTQEHISKWGWNVNDRGWINFPDYQMRVYKNNPKRIKWTKPVHEQLTGYTKFANLPSDEEFCLYHPKKINRQETQNKFYDTI